MSHGPAHKAYNSALSHYEDIGFETIGDLDTGHGAKAWSWDLRQGAKEGGWAMRNLRQMADRGGLSLEELASGGGPTGMGALAQSLGLDVGMDSLSAIAHLKKGGSRDDGADWRHERFQAAESKKDYWDKREFSGDEEMLLGSSYLDKLSDEDRTRLIADSDIKGGVGKFLASRLGHPKELGRSRGPGEYEKLRAYRRAAKSYIESMQTKRLSVGAGTLERKTAAQKSLEQRAQRRREYIR